MEPPARPASDLYLFFALACGLTWLLAIPAAQAWMRHQAPPPYAIACAGLSAFGPLMAALIVAGRRKQLGGVFGRWRAHPAWILLALFTPFLVHVLATALFVAIGGRPSHWFHPPSTPEAWAALVVFPLGEEFGWRGFAHPRLTERLGVVRASLLLGALWGLWHLMYAITPTAATFDVVEFGLTVVETVFYAVLIAWLFERTNRSMTVAIAIHAGAHLEHLQRGDLRLQVMHIVVLVVLAGIAAWSLSRRQPA
jgi:membrane protease YdiL (CAAX protease family)